MANVLQKNNGEIECDTCQYMTVEVGGIPQVADRTTKCQTQTATQEKTSSASHLFTLQLFYQA